MYMDFLWPTANPNSALAAIPSIFYIFIVASLTHTVVPILMRNLEKF